MELRTSEVHLQTPATVHSLNIGLQLDLDGYRDTAEDLLFNSSLPGQLGYTKGSFVLDKDSPESEIMMTAMGQGETMVSPYQMALITQAIANGGTLMEPYLVDSVTNYTGAEVKRNVPKSAGRLMTSEEAAQLKDYMSAVVNEGTGSVLAGRSYTAAGKTGTAQYSTTKANGAIPGSQASAMSTIPNWSSQSSQKVPTGALAEALYQLQEISLISYYD